MDEFRVPVFQRWNLPSGFISTPNNGLLYITGNKTGICYVPAIVENVVPKIKIYPTMFQIRSIDCDPNWEDDKKYFATVSVDNLIHIWDLETEKIIKGHQFLSKIKCTKSIPFQRNTTMAMPIGAEICFTKTKQLISVLETMLVKYCITSNKCKLFNNLVWLKNCFITILRASPYNEEFMAAGTTTGLILIINITDMSLKYKLRGHDNQIISLDWMILPQKCKSSGCVMGKKKMVNSTDSEDIEIISAGTEPTPKPLLDQNEIFDIYSFDHLENEFGALTSYKSSSSTTSTTNRIKNNADTTLDSEIGDYTEINNSKFDFVEACQSLKDDILRTDIDIIDDDLVIPTIPTSIGNFGETVGGTNETTQHTFSLSSDDCSDVIENVVDDGDVDEIKSIDMTNTTVNVECGLNDSDVEYHTYLISTAKESSIWIWDVDMTVGLYKIILNGFKKSQNKDYIKASWINENTILMTNAVGHLEMYTIDINESRVNCSIKKIDILDQSPITGFCTGQSDSSLIWTATINNDIVLRKIGDPVETLAHFDTATLNLHALNECPQDLNKFAVAVNYKRIIVFNTSTFKYNHTKFTSFMSNVHDYVLSLAWHPVNENILAFSTNEGRVGIINTLKSNKKSTPILMMPFTGNKVYSISWASINQNQTIDIESDADNNDIDVVEHDKEQNYALFACDSKILVYFLPQSQSSSNNYDKTIVNDAHDVSSVSGGNSYVAVGKQDGSIELFSKNLKKIWCEKLFNKYISHFSWSIINRNKLAVCSTENYICLLDCSIGKETKMIGKLCGHAGGLTSIKWSNETENKLVSSSCDGTVRVWNTDNLECISLYQFNSEMFTAGFFPTNDNYIICSGRVESLFIYDSTKHFHTYKKISVKCNDENQIDWATEMIAGPKSSSHIRKLRMRNSKNKGIDNNNNKLEKNRIESIEDLTDTLNNVLTLNDDNRTEMSGLEYWKSPTTLLNASNKEFNKYSTEILYKLLNIDGAAPAMENHPMENENTTENITTTDNNMITTADTTTNNIKEFLNLKLFSSKEDVKKLLEFELQNHRNTKTKSIANIAIPQILSDLKMEILNCIETKNLTDMHIALAPMISYEFWKNSCKCMANQHMESGAALLALPYLLSCYDIDGAIEMLCKFGNCREALIIAKIHKEEDDKIFIDIYIKWINELDKHGHLEGAAIIATIIKRYDLAFQMLSKRNNKSIQLEEITEILKNKTIN